ncbi:winged helix-turn-helix domain-containing protein [uncultured Roseovarius sp.]|uniref:winged helix-turn-helix domain-containing protein n=1 Tax=Roseovarius sp. TaxID=1486281 RepID=UPI0025FD2DAC|nr:crosslink repair DNA glycosylase YcaQ family protein [uncultured Roseovarius sp.]
MSGLEISNRDARRLWLAANGLGAAPLSGLPDVAAMIRALGFVQIDTIRNVTRAHHHILWSRAPRYRESMLWPLLGKKRLLFEHFTHDASLIPMEFLPNWQQQFYRLGQKAASSDWYRSGLAQDEVRAIRARIEAEGPLSTHAFDSRAAGREMWARPPHKKVLDQMWYAGDLATSHREKFIKFYDLGERVFPDVAGNCPPAKDQLNWLCDQALERLVIATPGEVQRFWGVASAPEVRAWLSRRRLVEVAVSGADGTRQKAWALPDIEARLAGVAPVARRLRILNPFDPAIRDRNRLLRLFGFHYRNEMFVPQSQRIWGYYVYPLLEGDTFVGRIELKADRAANWMAVTGFWPEPGVTWGIGRLERLEQELRRFSRLAGISTIRWDVARPG